MKSQTRDNVAPLGWDEYTNHLAKKRAQELSDDFLKAVAQIIGVCKSVGIKNPGRAFVFHCAMTLLYKRWLWPEYNQTDDFKKVMEVERSRPDLLG